MRAATAVLLRVVIAIFLSTIVSIVSGTVLVLGGLMALGQAWQKSGSGGTTWFIAVGLAAISPALAALSIRSIIRAAGATFSGTLAGAYAGAAAGLAFVYWTATHSLGFQFETLAMAVIGLACGAFIGATYRTARSRSELPWAETRWFDLASIALVLFVVGFQAFGVAERGLRDPRYVRTTIPRAGATEEPFGPAPPVAWRAETDFDLPLLASAPDGHLYRAEHYELVSMLATGAKDWRRESEADYDIDSLASVAEDGTIYTAHNSVLESYSSDGVPRWRVSAGGRVTGMSLSAEQTVYLCVGGAERKGAFVAIDRDGHERWRVPRNGPSGSTAIAVDGTIYESGKTLRAFAADGTLRWETSPARFNLNALAIGRDGTIYAEAAFEGVRAFSPDGRELWSFNGQGYTRGRDGSTFTLLVARDGTIYAAADNLYALSPNGILLWAWRGENPISDRRTAAILGDGTIVVATERGVLYGVTPQGKTKWKYAETPPDKVEPGPVKDLTVGADGTLRVHYESQILAFDPRSGPIATDGWPLPRHDPWNSGRAGAAYVILPPKPPGVSADTKQSIADLQSETQHTRVAAAEALAKGRERKSEEVVDALAAATKHPDPITRATVLASLGAVDSPRAIPAIIAALDDADPTVRGFAAAAAARTHGAAPAAVPKLISLLRSPAHAGNRYTLLLSLGMMGRDAQAALPEIERLRNDPNANVAEAARWAMAQVGSAQPH
ncbi:MAG TPA: HEAT repeat domain-containing protein [Thermoanaerobaculia bacterium]|nr:HEAT repeat domain-containing protein [Thermoanaerobaculia bacterium]